MALIQYEESYDIESDPSEDDCRKDTTGNGNNINLNESLPISVDDDETNTHMDVLNIKNGSIRSASINIDIERSDQDITISHGRERNKTIELYSDNLYDLHNCGRCYRLCCFSAFGIKLTILLNLIMVILNSGLIIYEGILIIRQQSVMHTKLPFWYMICDFIITIILFIEMFWTMAAMYNCSLLKYFKSGWHCWIDVGVLILSIGCCAAYYLDIYNVDIDNLTMLFVRVIRDIIRIIRCLWFFKMLYSNLIRLNINRKNSNTFMSFGGESLLDKLNMKSNLKLQINSSPKSTCSDQRYYKGPKRVDIYDDNDIYQMTKSNKKNKKYKNGKMYSLTPSPPHTHSISPSKKHNNTSKYLNIFNPSIHPLHKRNVTRNCEQFRLDDICNDNHDTNDNDDNEITIMSDDKSVISINSNIMSKNNPSRSVIHHRQTTTKMLEINNNNNNNNNNNENESNLSSFTEFTCNTDPAYWENLKLKPPQKKSVDKQRLRDILRNLPSGSIIDRESFSFDENEIEQQRLHCDNDTITIQ